MAMVRGGLIQMSLKGDTSMSPEKIRDKMLEAHLPLVEKAAKQKVQVLCFQEVFTQPYFCPSQDKKWYRATEKIPDGPTTRLMQRLAKKHGMVIVVPIYEEEMTGVYYNTAAVIDADGKFLGKFRKIHIPQVAGFYEKFFFKPGNLGYPVFDTAFCKLGVYICYDRHFPEGWRALGLAGAKVVFNPSATTRGHSKYLWQVEQPAAAVANEYFVGAINRVGSEHLTDTDYYGSSYFVSPRGEMVGAVASDTADEVVVRDLDMDEIEAVRRHWAFYRDRRPESYTSLTT